ncbi:hypothetical protein LTR66_014089 [Elasticomyces elasticus]|nr:hypothetical protein LTR66_014089 [Elasticomyces elasticus]
MNRRGIIHTIDVSEKYSKHAERVVRGFKHGIYAKNVDFHVGDVSQWIKEHQQQPTLASSEAASGASSELTPDDADSVQTAPSPSAPEPKNGKMQFLTHALLDLPSADTHLATVASALYTNSILTVFNPSITQIAECVRLIKQENLLLHLEQVVELGTGRRWDVRAVKPRASLKERARVENGLEAEVGELRSDDDDESAAKARDLEEAKAPIESETNDHWSLVCRPKVGERIVGGGFLGLWRKMMDRNDYEKQEEMATPD